MNPEEIFKGQTVFYSPLLGGPDFEAEVASEPVRLGGHTWVVHLKSLPEAYGQHVDLPGKTTVAAAGLHALRAKEEPGGQSLQ